ncbi:MAG TPA: hypothetical protein VGU02_10735 [Gaiellaceae bacterium]|nr:hypothetical protein [Gaiellaceae bacterium]
MRRALLLLTVLLAAGCGGGSSAPGLPTIGAARRYELTGFQPSGPVRPGVPTTVAFTIRQPNGKPLTQYKRGPGPHTGVHLIVVRRDLATIVHEHPPIAANGRASIKLTLPDPGPYRVVVDAYPANSGPQPNFQLFSTLRIAGKYVPKPLPPLETTQVVDGFRFMLHGRPDLHAIQAGELSFTVTDAQGKPVHFTPWFGALAHAIFFRKGSLDYFHTHVCAPGASGCTSVLGDTRVTGTSATPGKLTVGVLVPAPGVWRLFLQCKANGHVVTAPFTLTVKE